MLKTQQRVFEMQKNLAQLLVDQYGNFCQVESLSPKHTLGQDDIDAVAEWKAAQITEGDVLAVSQALNAVKEIIQDNLAAFINVANL